MIPHITALGTRKVKNPFQVAIRWASAIALLWITMLQRLVANTIKKYAAYKKMLNGPSFGVCDRKISGAMIKKRKMSGSSQICGINPEITALKMAI